MTTFTTTASLALVLVTGLVGCGGDDKSSTTGQGSSSSQTDAGAQSGVSMTDVFDSVIAAACDREIRCSNPAPDRQQCIDKVSAEKANERKAVEGKISRCTRAELEACSAAYAKVPCDDNDTEPPCDCDAK